MSCLRKLFYFALIAMTALFLGCGTSDDSDGSGTGTGSDTDGRGTSDRDTGSSVGTDAGADVGGGGGVCGAATPCAGNADCTSTEFCNAGCCSPRTDPGETDTGGGGGEPCGDLTFEGECVGETVRWCAEGTAAEIDCSAFYPAEAATGTCEHISVEFGYYCAVQPGDVCLFSADGEVQPAFCTGTEPGCILGAETVCQENVGTCTEADDGTCRDALMIAVCAEGQPIAFDCAAFSGSCSEGACIDQGEGGTCGAIGDATFTCADGLVCNADTGVCEAS